MLKINLTKGDGFLHQDIVLVMQGLDTIIKADSYWFFTSLSSSEKPYYRTKYSELMQSYYDTIQEVEFGKMIMFPLDVSDQCSGFIVVKKISKNGLCNLFYLDSYKDAGSFDPWKIRINDISWEEVIGIRGGVFCQLEDILIALKTSLHSILNEEYWSSK